MVEKVESDPLPPVLVVAATPVPPPPTITVYESNGLRANFASAEAPPPEVPADVL
jgi:hypothetical protein